MMWSNIHSLCISTIYSVAVEEGLADGETKQRWMPKVVEGD
jgi:hypothetical protein